MSFLHRLFGLRDYERGTFARFAAAIGGTAPAPRAESWKLSESGPGSPLYEMLTGGLSSAGVPVNERTVMMVSAVYACVDLIGGAIASLPAHIYRRTEAGAERIDHPLWWLLNEEAATAWTAASFWKYLVWSRLLYGDAFARIRRGGERGRRADEVIALEPLHPHVVEPKSNGARLKYAIHYNRTAASEAGVVVLDQDDVIHVPGPGFDGVRSMSTLKYALRHIGGAAIASGEFSSRFFRNGARPDFVIEIPGKLDDKQKQAMRGAWDEAFQGSLNSHRPAIMTGGSKIHELTMTAEDAQLIATRQFQVEDIARLFGVPPWLIGLTEKTTSWGSGIEQMGIGFVKYTLGGRHLTSIEQEFNRKLFARASPFMEFATAGLERGDLKSRSEAYRAGLGRAGEDAWLTINEVRRLENLPPLPGGDTLKKAVDAVPTPAPSVLIENSPPQVVVHNAPPAVVVNNVTRETEQIVERDPDDKEMRRIVTRFLDDNAVR